MTVTVTLVVGRDGSTSKNGNSAGVSSAADKNEFLARRRMANCILIGGNTARTEPYQRTPVPVIVLSRSLVNPLPGNHLAHVWNCSPQEALVRAERQFGSKIHVEAGAEIIQSLIESNSVDLLELRITDISGGDDPIEITKLLSHFSNQSQRVVDGTTLITASR